MDRDNKDVAVNYTGRIHFNNMGCTYRLNGLDFVFSPNVFNGKHDNISFMDDVGAFFQEGENSLEIQAVHLPTEPQNGSISFCEISVTAIAKNRKTGQKDSREVTHLKVTLDGEGKFTTEQSKEFEGRAVTDLPTLTILDEKAIKSIDWLNNDVMARRHLTINHPHRLFSWTEAKPLENTPENFERVWQAYQEMIQAFTERNEEKLTKLFLPAAKEVDNYEGYIGKDSRRWNAILGTFKENWNNFGYIPILMNKKDFKLEISENGKLFRLNKEGGIMASPLQFEGGKEGQLYNFYFTEVNGKIRPGII